MHLQSSTGENLSDTRPTLTARESWKCCPTRAYCQGSQAANMQFLAHRFRTTGARARLPCPKLRPSRARSQCRRRVPENPWSSWDCAVNEPISLSAHLQLGRAYAMFGHGESPCYVARVPHALERRRPRHPRPEASQSRVREAAIAVWAIISVTASERTSCGGNVR